MNYISLVLSGILQTMISGKSNNIFFEYAPSATPGHKTVVLLCGVPAQPKQYAVIEWFANAGFDVFFPRYEGTWESDGVFLSPSPIVGINTLIDSIHTGLMLNDAEYRSEEVYVFGASFGGGVALALDDAPYLKKVCAVSPVVSYAQVKGIETLGAHLKSAFPNDYRFDMAEWEKLVRDELYCPLRETKPPATKIMVVAGKDDDQIMADDLKQYAGEKGIKYLLEDTGHITPSRVSENLFAKILTFFNE